METIEAAQTTVTGKRCFSVEDVSKQTTLSKAYLRNKIRDGELAVTRFGRRVLILSEDLDAFLGEEVSEKRKATIRSNTITPKNRLSFSPNGRTSFGAIAPPRLED